MNFLKNQSESRLHCPSSGNQACKKPKPEYWKDDSADTAWMFRLKE